VFSFNERIFALKKMDLNLKNKLVVVIGGSNGIGLSIVKKFLNEGAIVHSISRNGNKIDEKFLNDRYKNFIFFHKADAKIEDDLEKCKNNITKNESKFIDILISNVGNGRTPNNPINDNDIWTNSWNTNFDTGLNSSRVFYKSIKNGSILFIASIAGQEFLNAPTDYSVAKSALITFAKILSNKLAPNIRVNVVSPGNIFIKNGTWDKIKKDSPNLVKDILDNKVPLQRFGKPEEIADLVLFLSSEKASFITGSCNVIDGGQTNFF
tara:strand:- start:90 stop:887 length:798 start_codon:yes stop_codon:yes gene_type:complete